MKYLHKSQTVSAFTEDYNGSGYTEPWVSYTGENEAVNYNKDIIDLQPIGTFHYADFGITQETLNRWNNLYDNHADLEEYGVLVLSEQVVDVYRTTGNDAMFEFYGESTGAYVGILEDYVHIWRGDNVK